MTATMTARTISAGELRADGIVHAVGFAGSVLGAGALVAWMALSRGPAEVAATSAYALGLIAMFGCSAVYNSATNPKSRAAWRRRDHAAIFLMTAGTYTPFTATALSGGLAVALTALVWAIAAVGIFLKLAYPPARRQTRSAVLYVAFGWIGLVAVGPFLAVLRPEVLALLVAGGLVYTLGTIFFALQKLPYQRAIWHGFVLAGAILHFFAVAELMAPAA